jgi:hypothetical protein
MKKVFRLAGITNKLRGNNYCLFLDYDNMSEKQIDAEANELRKEFPRIPTMWIINTRPRHYWILSFGVFVPAMVLLIMFRSKCDPNYFKAFKIYKKNTIRLTRKKGDKSVLKLHKIMRKAQKSYFNGISKKHTALFENMFKVNDTKWSDRHNLGMETVSYFSEV